MKLWTISGIPPVITAVSALASAEAAIGVVSGHSQNQPNLTASAHYNSLALDRQVEQQGYAFMKDIYQHNLDPIMSTWGSHQEDFEWLEKRIIYGLFLSDHRILSKVETELVVLSGMMCQGLRDPAHWHLRGLRRLGVSMEDAKSVVASIRAVAEWCGRGTQGWVQVEDVEAEVGSQEP